MFWEWARRAALLTYDDFLPLLRLCDQFEPDPARMLGHTGELRRIWAPYLAFLIGENRLDAAQQVAQGMLADRANDPYLLNRQFGLDDAYEEQYLEVIMPALEERRLLSIPPRTYAVRIRGLSLDKAGTPFDCFEQVYPAAEFAFAISGSASRHLFPTPGFQNWEVRPLAPEAGDA